MRARARALSMTLGLAGALAAPAGASGQAPAEPAAMAAPAPPIGNGTGVKTLMKEALTDVAKSAMGEAASAAGQAAKAPAAPAAAPANDPLTRAAALRRKTLRDEDFLEADDNRDPFRSYLRLFVEKGVQPVRKVPAIFEKFALEELTLIGIVSGDANPRAMFRDPGGLGQTIKRGDYVSKAGARVTKILSDRVILELSEVNAAGEARPIEKAVLVNPEESQNK